MTNRPPYADRESRLAFRQVEELIGGMLLGPLLRRELRPTFRAALNPPQFFDPEELAKW